MRKSKIKKITASTLIAIISLVIGYTIWIPNEKVDLFNSSFAAYVQNKADGPYTPIIVKKFSEIASNYDTPTIDCGSAAENAKWTWNESSSTFSATGLTSTKSCKVYFGFKPSYALKINTITVDNVQVSEIPRQAKYHVNPNCTGATATWNYASWSLEVSELTQTKASCSPIFTSVVTSGANANLSTLFGDANNTASGKLLYAHITDATTISNSNSTITSLGNVTAGDGNTYDAGTRYKGANPNNYVLFNNEIWRIIGAFSGTDYTEYSTDYSGATPVETGTAKTNQTVVRIIRNESIGGYAYNSPSTNGGWWSKSSGTQVASLNYMLNNYYIKGTDGTSNSNCRFYQTSVTRNCDYTKIGIQDEYRDMVVSTKWYTAAGVDSSTAETSFTGERGTTAGKAGGDLTYTNRVGLIYPSDYLYSGTSASARWMLQNGNEWTLSPHSTNALRAWHFNSQGNLANNSAYYGYAVRPVLNLSSSVYIVSGDGSLSNPYVINGE